MNTYLLRLLVAAVTFTVGLAISSIPFLHRSKVREFNYQRRHDCSKRNYQPSVRVPLDSNAPLQITYLGPGGDFQNGESSTARLLVQNVSGRDVSNFSVNYVSGWRNSRTRVGGSIQSDLESRGSLLRAGESTMVDVGATQEVYLLWLSSVEFVDGNRWNYSPDLSIQPSYY
jgi:hypothetical protein